MEMTTRILANRIGAMNQQLMLMTAAANKLMETFDKFNQQICLRKHANDLPTISENILNDEEDWKQECQHKVLEQQGTNTNEEDSSEYHSLAAVVAAYENDYMNDYLSSKQIGYLGDCKYCYLKNLEQKLIAIERILNEGGENFDLINRELYTQTQIERFRGIKCIHGQQRHNIACNSDDKYREQQSNDQQVQQQQQGDVEDEEDAEDFAYETFMSQSLLHFIISKNINHPEWAQLFTFIEQNDYPYHCNECSNYIGGSILNSTNSSSSCSSRRVSSSSSRRVSSSSSSSSNCSDYSNGSNNASGGSSSKGNSSRRQSISISDEDEQSGNTLDFLIASNNTDQDQRAIQTVAYIPPPTDVIINKQSDQSNTKEPEQHVRTSSTSTNLCIALSDKYRAARSDVRDTFKLAVEYGANPKRKPNNVNNLETSGYNQFGNTAIVPSPSLCCTTTVSDAKFTSFVYNAIAAADSGHCVCSDNNDLLPDDGLQFSRQKVNTLLLNEQTATKLNKNDNNNNNNHNNNSDISQTINILNSIADANRLLNRKLIENMPISRSSNIDIDSIRSSRNFLRNQSNIVTEKGSLKNNDVRYEARNAKESPVPKTKPTHSLSKHVVESRLPDLSTSSKSNRPLLCSHSLCDTGTGSGISIATVNVNNTGSNRVSTGSGSSRSSTVNSKPLVDSKNFLTSASNNLHLNDSNIRRAHSTDDTLDKVLPERTRLRRQRRLLAENSDDAEDPIIRLNRLKARISGALTEVKGVLKQYTVDDTEAEDNQSTPKRPLSTSDCSNLLITAKSQHTESDIKAPVQFRFVKKTKRHALFYDDDNDCIRPLSTTPQKPSNNLRTLNTPVTTNHNAEALGGPHDCHVKYNLENSTDTRYKSYNLTDTTTSPIQIDKTPADLQESKRPNLHQIETEELARNDSSPKHDEPKENLASLNPTQVLPSNQLFKDQRSLDISDATIIKPIKTSNHNTEPTITTNYLNLQVNKPEKELENSREKELESTARQEDYNKSDIQNRKPSVESDKLEQECKVEVTDDKPECENRIEKDKQEQQVETEKEIRNEKNKEKYEAQKKNKKTESKAEKKIINKQQQNREKLQKGIVSPHSKIEEKSNSTIQEHNKEQKKIRNSAPEKVELLQKNDKKSEVKVEEKLGKHEDRTKLKPAHEIKKLETQMKDNKPKVSSEESLKSKEQKDKEKLNVENSCKNVEPKKSTIKIHLKTQEKILNKEQQSKEEIKCITPKANTQRTDTPKENFTNLIQENQDYTTVENKYIKKTELPKNDYNNEVKITEKFKNKEQQKKEYIKIEGNTTNKIENVSEKVDAQKKEYKPTLQCEDKYEKKGLEVECKESNQFVTPKNNNKIEVKVEKKINKHDEQTKAENKFNNIVNYKKENCVLFKGENKSQEDQQSNQVIVKNENELQKDLSGNNSQLTKQKDSKVNIKGSLSRKVPSPSKEQSSGVSRMATLVANNIAANKRRASLAEIENTKSEPSLELCLPCAINRRPSDSEAILKKVSKAKLMDIVTPKDETAKSKSKIHKTKAISPLKVCYEKTNELLLTSANTVQSQQTATIPLHRTNVVNKTIKQSADESHQLPHLPNLTTTAVISSDDKSMAKPLVVIDELPLSSIAECPIANASMTITAIDQQCPNEYKTSTFVKKSPQIASIATSLANVAADSLENTSQTPSSAPYSALNSSHAPLTADAFSESVVAPTHSSQTPTALKTADSALVVAPSKANSSKSNRKLAIETANEPHSNSSNKTTTTTKAQSIPPSPSPPPPPTQIPTNCTANIAKETPLSQLVQTEELSTAVSTATSTKTLFASNAKEFIQSTEIANSYNVGIQSDTLTGKTATVTLNTEYGKMPELQLIPPPVQRIDTIATVQHSVKSTSPTQQLLKDSSTAEGNYQDSNAEVKCAYRPATETNEIAHDLDKSDQTVIEINEADSSQNESSDLQTVTDVKPKKERKVKKKVIINRQRRRLSASDYFFTSVFDGATGSISDTLEIPIAYVTDDEDEEEEQASGASSLEHNTTCNSDHIKPLKSCLKQREYQIGDEILFAERFKKTQIRWKRGRVKERICSISYLLDIDGKEISAHVNYLKAFNKRKVNFSTEEYLDIKYEQLNELEDNDDLDLNNEEETQPQTNSSRALGPNKKQKYSIWNMV